MVTIGLIHWLKDKLTGEFKQVSAEVFWNIAAECCFKDLAFWSAVNLIAKAISKCEIKTKIAGENQKGAEYYLWNVEPNKNQNSSVFFAKLIGTLCLKNEALVVESDDGQLLIADSYQHKEYALYGDTFSDVTIGDYAFHRTFRQADVLFFQMHCVDMRKVVNSINESYGKLIATAEKYFARSRGSKGTLTVPAAMTGTDAESNAISNYLNNYVKKFLDSDNGALPVFNGYTYTPIEDKMYKNETSRDLRAMIDDIYDFTARAFSIPPVLLRGDTAGIKDVLGSFLTFCIDPLTDMLREEIVRKRIGREGALHGYDLTIDTRTIQHVDILQAAEPVDKLIASGAYSINDIRDLLGDERIDEPWADEHYITKNYTTFDETLKSTNGKGVSEGGE